MALRIKVDARGLLDSLDSHEKAFRERSAMNAAIGEALVVKVQDHLAKNYLPRDKDGLTFWARVRDSLEFETGNRGGSIYLTEIGTALRYYGGEVTPGKNLALSGPSKGKPTRALAIPTRSVPVRGGSRVRPVNAGKLAFVGNRANRETVGYLVEAVEKLMTRGKRKGQRVLVPKKGGALMYVLRTITRHRGDRNILPSEAALQEAATQAANDYLDSFTGE